MLHLNRLSKHAETTGMTSKNLAIVWAPNLIKTSPPPTLTLTPTTPPTSPTATDNKTELIRLAQQQQTQLQFSLVQNTQIVQYLIENAKWLFEQRTSSTSAQQQQQQHQSNNKVQPVRIALTKTEEPTKVVALSKFNVTNSKLIIANECI